LQELAALHRTDFTAEKHLVAALASEFHRLFDAIVVVNCWLLLREA
jgi:hypothetical protein